MKYLKIIFFVWLVFFSGVSLAFDKAVDCSAIEFSVYISKQCTVIKGTVKAYPITGVPEEIMHRITAQHLKKNIESGGRVKFLETDFKISSIFPPKESRTVWYIEFNDDKFVGQTETEFRLSGLLLTVMIIIITCILISGYFGESTLSPIFRHVSISILFGLFFGLFFGVFTSSSVGALAGAFVGLLIGGPTGMFAGLLTGTITGTIATEYDITHSITLEWIGFCFGMVILEYLIVFLRRKYQQKTESFG